MLETPKSSGMSILECADESSLVGWGFAREAEPMDAPVPDNVIPFLRITVPGPRWMGGW